MRGRPPHSLPPWPCPVGTSQHSRPPTPSTDPLALRSALPPPTTGNQRARPDSVSVTRSYDGGVPVEGAQLSKDGRGFSTPDRMARRWLQAPPNHLGTATIRQRWRLWRN